jgi:DNA-binding SARP family transcriptional activator
MTTVEIDILGSMRTLVEGREIRLPGRKLRCIFTVLCLRAGQQVRRDELIEELHLTDTADAVNSLHAHIARLRRWLRSNSLDPGLLESIESSYRLNIDRAAVDVYTFESRVEQALSLYPDAPSVVVAMLTDALILWRGEALADVDDGPLVAGKAQELRHLRATAREVLLAAWLDVGEHRRVVLEARRFLVADPLNEQVWQSLIIALRRCGRPAEANQTFRDAQSIFREELGIMPGERMRSALTGPLPGPAHASDASLSRASLSRASDSTRRTLAESRLSSRSRSASTAGAPPVRRNFSRTIA